MSLVTLLTLITIITFKCAEADGDSCPGGSTSNTMTLKKKIFCSYDSTVRPVKEHTNTTEVSVNMYFQMLVFNEPFNSLEVHSWMVWNWKDEHLKWDKNEYNGLDKLQILSSEIWTPDVTIYNAGTMYSVGTGLPETRCSVNYQGNVTCVSPTVYEAMCVPNIRRWPFDSHNCSVRVGSWSHTGEQINLTKTDEGISADGYEPSRDWELIYYNATRVTLGFKNNTYPWMKYTMTLRRHPGGQAATVVIPAIVLSVVTLASFWMSPVSSQRLGLIYMNLVSHCMYMMFLGVMLPNNGDDTPIIVTFFRDSFLMAAISLLVTLCTARMITAVSAPPSWISTTTDVILALPPGQILLLGELDPKGVASAKTEGTEDNADLVGAVRGAGGWQLFATLLDRLFFIIFFITIFILLCAYIP